MSSLSKNPSHLQLLSSPEDLQPSTLSRLTTFLSRLALASLAILELGVIIEGLRDDIQRTGQPIALKDSNIPADKKRKIEAVGKEFNLQCGPGATTGKLLAIKDDANSIAGQYGYVINNQWLCGSDKYSRQYNATTGITTDGEPANYITYLTSGTGTDEIILIPRPRSPEKNLATLLTIIFGEEKQPPEATAQQ